MGIVLNIARFVVFALSVPINGETAQKWSAVDRIDTPLAGQGIIRGIHTQRARKKSTHVSLAPHAKEGNGTQTGQGACTVKEGTPHQRTVPVKQSLLSWVNSTGEDFSNTAHDAENMVHAESVRKRKRQRPNISVTETVKGESPPRPRGRCLCAATGWDSLHGEWLLDTTRSKVGKTKKSRTLTEGQ